MKSRKNSLWLTCTFIFIIFILALGSSFAKKTAMQRRFSASKPSPICSVKQISWSAAGFDFQANTTLSTPRHLLHRWLVEPSLCCTAFWVSECTVWEDTSSSSSSPRFHKVDFQHHKTENKERTSENKIEQLALLFNLHSNNNAPWTWHKMANESQRQQNYITKHQISTRVTNPITTISIQMCLTCFRLRFFFTRDIKWL